MHGAHAYSKGGAVTVGSYLSKLQLFKYFNLKIMIFIDTLLCIKYTQLCIQIYRFTLLSVIQTPCTLSLHVQVSCFLLYLLLRPHAKLTLVCIELQYLLILIR